MQGGVIAKDFYRDEDEEDENAPRYYNEETDQYQIEFKPVKDEDDKELVWVSPVGADGKNNIYIVTYYFCA